jgi:hypothetical protein
MTEYRIAEEHKRFYIEVRHDGKEWHDLKIPNVPRFFDSLADARSWVATIKRGVVYHDAEAPPLSESDPQWESARDFRIFRNHDAEEAPNLAQDERKAEGDTSDGIKPIGWFLERVGKQVWNKSHGYMIEIDSRADAMRVSGCQQVGYRYSDPS